MLEQREALWFSPAMTYLYHTRCYLLQILIIPIYGSICVIHTLRYWIQDIKDDHRWWFIIKFYDVSWLLKIKLPPEGCLTTNIFYQIIFIVDTRNHRTSWTNFAHKEEKWMLFPLELFSFAMLVIFLTPLRIEFLSKVWWHILLISALWRWRQVWPLWIQGSDLHNEFPVIQDYVARPCLDKQLKKKWSLQVCLFIILLWLIMSYVEYSVMPISKLFQFSPLTGHLL